MSHSLGTVRFKDGKVLHYEYNGTCDVVCNCLYDTKWEVKDNWRDQPDRECTCGCDEDVVIHTLYGGGFSWEGKACRFCRAITKGLSPH